MLQTRKYSQQATSYLILLTQARNIVINSYIFSCIFQGKSMKWSNYTFKIYFINYLQIFNYYKLITQLRRSTFLLKVRAEGKLINLKAFRIIFSVTIIKLIYKYIIYKCIIKFFRKLIFMQVIERVVGNLVFRPDWYTLLWTKQLHKQNCNCIITLKIISILTSSQR